MTEQTIQPDIITIAKAVMPTVIAISATLFGAVAHAIEEVRKAGWRGWVSFLSDIVMCSFVGYVFFHILMLTGHADYAVIGSSIGSYWGTKGFVKVRDIFLDTIIKLKTSR